MWLINVKTRLLEEYFGSNIPPYAILSHTWEDEEVTYKQYVAGNYHWLKGYQKINMTCRIAARDKIGYAWVDTCCIDKSSSAELSEAINSMFRWYKRARVCYVYLADLQANADLDAALGNCRWFTRGWTLQELIAPTHIKFFDSTWDTAPERTKSGLVELLSAITNIDALVLSGERDLGQICVAQKMSWAAGRISTRIEDNSYCLLGIFDLHMPLLYGEEEMAFLRLQEEIIRSTADLSILAWTIPRSQFGWNFEESVQYRPINTTESQLCGSLAKSADDFKACGKYERTFEGGLREFSISNIGIRTRIRLQGVALTEISSFLSLPLNCTFEGARLGVRLKQVSRLDYLRQDPWELCRYTSDDRATFPPSERFLLTDIPRNHLWSNCGLTSVQYAMATSRRYVARILPDIQVSQQSLRSKLLLRRPWPADRYDHEDTLFFVSRNAQHDFGIINVTFEIHGYEKCTVKATLIMLGWSEGPNRWPQFSIVDQARWSSVLGLLRDQQSESVYTSGKLVEYMRAGRVPCTRSVQRQIDGTSLMSVLSITANNVGQNEMSGEICYDVKVSASIVPMGQGPVFEHVTWQPFPD